MVDLRQHILTQLEVHGSHIFMQIRQPVTAWNWNDVRLSLLLTPSGAETLVFWVSQPLPWPVAPKDVPLMTRRGDLKLSHGATAKARENAVKQDRVPTTNAIKSP